MRLNIDGMAVVGCGEIPGWKKTVDCVDPVVDGRNTDGEGAIVIAVVGGCE